MSVAVAATAAWREAHPHALIGILEVAGVQNTLPAPALEQRKREAEERLRQRYGGFSRSDFIAAPVLGDYVRYYKSFEKTYHVQLQLESLVLKMKPFPTVSPLVDANFVAELETLVLTAGHDVERLQAPVCIDVSREGDCITQMNGSMRPMRAGDMVMRDAEGISCSIIYGQDSRSPISGRTTHALYVAYAPPGVPEAAVAAQLDGILANIRSFAPGCVVEERSFLRSNHGQ